MIEQSMTDNELDIYDEGRNDGMKQLAWEIHCRIYNGCSLSDLDKYVTDICDF
jgi:hypothetical protein